MDEENNGVLQKLKYVGTIEHRPYDKDVGQYICDEVRKGKLLGDICKTINEINVDTFYFWRSKNSDLKKEYDLAVVESQTAFLHEAIKIADDDSQDEVVEDFETGKVRVNKAKLERDKLRVKTRMDAAKALGITKKSESMRDRDRQIQPLIVGIKIEEKGKVMAPTFPVDENDPIVTGADDNVVKIAELNEEDIDASTEGLEL